MISSIQEKHHQAEWLSSSDSVRKPMQTQRDERHSFFCIWSTAEVSTPYTLHCQHGYHSLHLTLKQCLYTDYALAPIPHTTLHTSVMASAAQFLSQATAVETLWLLPQWLCPLCLLLADVWGAHVWFAGQGRACLQSWIRAALVVQRATKVWQFRQLLRQGRHTRLKMLLAVTRLQAMWRGRQPFKAYRCMRHAAIRTQVSPGLCIGTCLCIGML